MSNLYYYCSSCTPPPPSTSFSLFVFMRVDRGSLSLSLRLLKTTEDEISGHPGEAVARHEKKHIRQSETSAGDKTYTDKHLRAADRNLFLEPISPTSEIFLLMMDS
ncbi:hypothetical protein INR49_000261 [Caranx melampygus]|nr:hypothetical protein INR49_000261 [Caranx melampygus]